MSGPQLDITESFGDDVEHRRERVAELQARAESLARRWCSVFGSADTPVPVDRGYHHTVAALHSLQDPAADTRLDAAAEALDRAERLLDHEEEPA